MTKREKIYFLTKHKEDIKHLQKIIKNLLDH